MNPIVVQLGGLEIRAFTFWIGLGAALCIALIVWRGRAQPIAHLDVAVAAAFCGVIGARAGHVALNWAYFSAHTGEIWSLSSGGLNWHGALIGCLFGAQAVAQWRKLDSARLRDSLALCLPIGAIVTWQACVEATCGYGVEVRTLADYPAWLAVESPDIYGVIAPRLNLPVLGVAYAGILGIFVLLLTWRRRLSGARLWLVLALYALGMALISGFRAEYVPYWFGVRADQALDLIIALWASLLFVRALSLKKLP
ncbi:MAG: prolipoprotein diacylglyceryl transferase [Anaerolineae bacterium]|nr:prolipoprotein diacylglyceryl transferase [Anaerolineae bacterium]